MSEPNPKKRIKKTNGTKLQTNIFSFFAPPSENQKTTTDDKENNEKKTTAAAPLHSDDDNRNANDETAISTPSTQPRPQPPLEKALQPPSSVPPPRNANWHSLHDLKVLIRKPYKEPPRTKVAALDLDGTLVCWTSQASGFWPSQLSHYELWNRTIPQKLRQLYDEGAYKLVVVSNQGGIQKAHQGKKARLVQQVVDWIASLVDRPLSAVISTQSPKKTPDSFHKPSPKLWKVAIDALNKRQDLDISQSFFVGDSADLQDAQGGVDLRFAQAVGQVHGGTSSAQLKFYTPTEYFGPSDQERRKKTKLMAVTGESPPPKEALQARLALLGGYYSQYPLLLILCGVQGSGKSTFCQQLLESANIVETQWVHLSQDTINNGKPGKRESVEQEALAALKKGYCVVVDRMHLTPDQRAYFVNVAKQAHVPCHVVLLNPPAKVISQRVLDRRNHAAKVQGDQGVRLALQPLEKLVVPTYKEGVQLISCAAFNEEVVHLAELYHGATRGGVTTQEVPSSVALSETFRFPTVTLGTMGMGRKKTKDSVLAAIEVGIRAVDTAPTYRNEDKVGDALVEGDQQVLCVAKIPKAVTQPEQVRDALEESLSKLRRKSVSLLLLHWPCDVMATGTLEGVWKEMESCLREGLCEALGVSNFNVAALATLLPICTIPPLINQVERHPLLSQAELLDFCSRNNIFLQAHSPLGQGKPELLSNPTIQRICNETSMSPAQVVVRWNLQHRVMVVPKCSTSEHAEEMLETSGLSPEQMQAIDSLDCGQRFVAPPFMCGSSPYCW